LNDELAGRYGYSEFTLGAQVGRILPFFSVLVPFWLVWAYAGFKVNTPEKVFTSTSTWHTLPSQITNPQIPVNGLDKLVQRIPPVVAKPTAERAVFGFNWISATGSGILFAAIIAGFIMGLSLPKIVAMWFQTLWHIRFSLMTIAAMLSIGIMTRYSGVDATMGLAFARTGHLYPFFGTLLGWLGVALTGSDTSSNVLFGSLQKISAQQIGLSPILMGAANSAGGVMGKMIDAQSIVVASTATEWYGHEGDILRYVFWHSIALACLVGVMVFMQAYLYPFTKLVAH
jgi:lactate permease